MSLRRTLVLTACSILIGDTARAAKPVLGMAELKNEATRVYRRGGVWEPSSLISLD